MSNRLLSILENMQQVMVGKEKIITRLLVALLAGGHVLLEDVPGVGKTLMARSLAQSTGGTFKRIQFTPDLLPSDITGFTIYDERTREFRFRKGPVFTNYLLADEINRTIPRTQSSLLEAMEEGQITTAGETRILPRPFFVMATQNPIESTGTFPLPEAQLDRFLMKLTLGYPRENEEIKILERFQGDTPLQGLKIVVEREEIPVLQKSCQKIRVSREIQEYIVKITTATRSHPAVSYGASPRGSLHLMRTGQAMAFLQGRDYILPHDIKELVRPVLEHRIILNRQDRLEGLEKGKVLQEILEQTPIPLPGIGGETI